MMCILLAELAAVGQERAVKVDTADLQCTVGVIAFSEAQLTKLRNKFQLPSSAI